MPSTTPQHAGLLDGFLVSLVRMTWRWRTELGVVWTTWIVYAVLAIKVGSHWAEALLAVLLAGVLAAPHSRRWLTGRLRLARVRRQLTLAVSQLHARTLSERPPVVRRVEQVSVGTRLTLTLQPGTHIGDLDLHSEAIAVALRARSIRAERDRSRADIAYLTIVESDPLGNASLPWPRADAERVDAWAPIPVGIDEVGEPVWMSLPERNLLVGGEPGAGKSVALSVLLASAALDPGVDLWLLDGKLVELAPWRAVARRFVGPDIQGAIALLDELRAEMDERYSLLLERNQRKVAPGEGLPLHVVVIDELVLFTSHPDRKLSAVFAEHLRDLVARGRAAGVVVLAATQKPSIDVVPSALRDLFTFRWALRCATREASDTVLGTGWATNGFSAAEIDPANRGVGLLLHEGGIPIRLRSYWLDDESVASIARRAVSVRSAL